MADRAPSDMEVKRLDLSAGVRAQQVLPAKREETARLKIQMVGENIKTSPLLSSHGINGIESTRDLSPPHRLGEC